MHTHFVTVRKRHPEFLIPLERVCLMASPGCRKGGDIESLVGTCFPGQCCPIERARPGTAFLVCAEPARVMHSLRALPFLRIFFLLQPLRVDFSFC